MKLLLVGVQLMDKLHLKVLQVLEDKNVFG